MAWLAEELGLRADQIQVYLPEVLAYSTDIQPCEMCARLKDAAAVLLDSDGVRIAALVRVVNELAAPSQPISEELIATISQVLAQHRGTDDGTPYARAVQWLDALVTYVGILTNEMGWPAEHSVAFAMDKYGRNLRENGDAIVVAYVHTQLLGLAPPAEAANRPAQPPRAGPAASVPFAAQSSAPPLADRSDVPVARASTEPVYILGTIGTLSTACVLFAGWLYFRRRRKRLTH
jgi:hypothetical protein